MFKIFEHLFGAHTNPDFKVLIEQGATILDVRTAAEYDAGHIPSSINIPLDQLKYHLNSIDKNSSVITCCVTGMRSESAKRTLKEHGFENVYNAGNWEHLQKYLYE